MFLDGNRKTCREKIWKKRKGEDSSEVEWRETVNYVGELRDE